MYLALVLLDHPTKSSCLPHKNDIHPHDFKPFFTHVYWLKDYHFQYYRPNQDSWMASLIYLYCQPCAHTFPLALR